MVTDFIDEYDGYLTLSADEQAKYPIVAKSAKALLNMEQTRNGIGLAKSLWHKLRTHVTSLKQSILSTSTLSSLFLIRAVATLSTMTMHS